MTGAGPVPLDDGGIETAGHRRRLQASAIECRGLIASLEINGLRYAARFTV